MNNPPAFPWCGDLNDCPTINLGMTLRDYFAAKALSSPLCAELSKSNNWNDEIRGDWTYKQADVMLKARGK